MQQDEKVNKLLTEALDKLDLAVNEILETKNWQEKYTLGTLGRAIGLIREFQKQIIQRNPKLKPSSHRDTTPPPLLTGAQKEKIAELSKDEINKIDELLLKNITVQWQKTAKIVGTSLLASSSDPKEIPDLYYAQRIEAMAKSGIIESQGNIHSMRHSEVRKKSSQKES